MQAEFTGAEFTGTGVLDLTTTQHKYKVAVANAAGTTTDNIDILAITEGRRRAERVKVETKVRLCVCDLKHLFVLTLKHVPVLADLRE